MDTTAFSSSVVMADKPRWRSASPFDLGAESSLWLRFEGDRLVLFLNLSAFDFGFDSSLRPRFDGDRLVLLVDLSALDFALESCLRPRLDGDRLVLFLGLRLLVLDLDSVRFFSRSSIILSILDFSVSCVSSSSD